MASELCEKGLQIQLQRDVSINVDMERGMLEGSPLSMLMIIVVQSMILNRLLANPLF